MTRGFGRKRGIWCDCRYPGCKQRITQKQFFCWDHWFAVPRALQDELVLVDRRDGRHRAVELIPGAINAINRSLGISKTDTTPAADGAAGAFTEGQ